MIWRLGLRLTTQIPPAPDGPRLFQTLSRVSHWLFYAILIAMPVAGAAAWFIPSETVGAAHAVTSKVLIGLHIAGAFYHQFIAGDRSVLRRMLAR
jgi:cytochrome b561